MNLSRSQILFMKVHVATLKKVTEAISNYVRLKKSSYVCISNVHMCMETYDCREFRDVVNGADLVLADGRPIFWAQRLMGMESAEHVRGQDVMGALCELGEKSQFRIGLYGGATGEVLSKVKDNLIKEYPSLKIVFTYSPPFRALTEAEDRKVVDEINANDVDILFVGIGCPKQERWMAEHKGKVNAVMLGVGAAFDFISGEKSHAPIFLQKLGLEWLFRLCSEPRRLWKRYLKQNPRFMFYFFRQWVFGINCVDKKFED